MKRFSLVLFVTSISMNARELPRIVVIKNATHGKSEAASYLDARQSGGCISNEISREIKNRLNKAG